MSASLAVRARKQRVGNGIAKALLCHLATEADDHGNYPSGLDAIVAAIEFTPRAVQRAATHLINLGLIQRHDRKTENGKCLCPMWHVGRVGLAPADKPPLNGSAPVNKPPSISTPSARVTPTSSFLSPKKELPPAFLEFWKMYPRKDARPDALKAWHAATTKRGHKPSVILGGLSSWLQHGRFSPDPQFHPLPASWLNKERWLDEGPRAPQMARQEDRPTIFPDEPSAREARRIDI